MCYWGLYQAQSNYHSTAGDYATASLAKAQELARHASAAERLYIEASVVHERAAQANPRPGAEELSIRRKLVERYPADTQAKVFLANSLQDGFDSNGEPRAGQREALALLREILRVDPRNSAAHHYLIHTLEAVHPEQALEDAQVLASLAPTSGHMVHMPGHIYYRLGDYTRAEQAFADSLEADERYMRDQAVRADDNWNYVHNLMYAITNLLEEGKRKKAEELSLKLSNARGELASTLYPFSARDSFSRIEPALPVALRLADWAKVLTLANGGAEQALPNLHFLKQSIADFAEGMQAVAKDNIATAEESSRRLEAQLADATQRMKPGVPGATPTGAGSGGHQIPVMPDALLGPLVSYLSVMSLELRGSLLLLKKQSEESGMLFTQAAKQEQELGYREPPNFIRPAREAEGAALLAAQDWTGATTAYKSALAERPRSGFPLFAIAMSYEGAGDIAAAMVAYGEFLEAWKEADAESPEVAHAQAFRAEHRS